MRGFCCWLLFLFPLIPIHAVAATHRVPSDYPTIQAGIDACAEGDIVLVAPGTYTGEGNRDLNFHGVNLVLWSEAGSEATTIHCEMEGQGFVFENGESAASVVIGFRVEQGSRGLTCIDASPTLIDLQFWFCSTWSEGGAAYFRGSNSRLQDIRFMYNDATDVGELGFQRGGAVYAEDSHLEVCDSDFCGNVARFIKIGWECCSDALGGAIYAVGEGSLTLLRCGFAANWVSAESRSGSAIYAEVPLALDQVTLAGHRVLEWTVPAIHAEDSVQLHRSVFAHNGRAFNFSANLDQCIVFDNDPADQYTGDYIEADPLICGASSGEFTVAIGSPCLPEENAWGELIGSDALGCLDLGPVEFFEASRDSADGVQLTWVHPVGAIEGYCIRRNGQILDELPPGQPAEYWDGECEQGEVLYSITPFSGAESWRSESDLGYRARPRLTYLYPGKDEVLPIGQVCTIRWRSNTDLGAIDIELSRNGYHGDYGPLFTATPDDGSEDWLVTGPYSQDCRIRLSQHDGDVGDNYHYSPFKIGTKTIVVPLEYSSIPSAMSELGRGDTLAIQPGTYVVPLTSIREGVTVRGLGANSCDVILTPDAGQGGMLRFNDVEGCRLETLTLTGTVTGSAVYSYLAEAEIFRCRFIDNERIYGPGAAIHDQWWSDLTLRECEFAGNKALSNGGAIAAWRTNLKVIDCVFRGNMAGDDGGALHGSNCKMFIQGTTIAGNSCGGKGSAISMEGDSLVIRNSILHGNVGPGILTCEGAVTDFECSVFFANSSGDVSPCFDADFYEEGNLFVDPIFCNIAAGDYRLDPASPCLPENNDCGVLIGALGQGCEDTPVLLSSFSATPGTGAVDLIWQAEGAADFRLSAELSGVGWLLAWEVDGDGNYGARDRHPELAAGGEVRYRLEGRLPHETWQLLRTLSVELPPAYVTRLLAPHPNPFNPRVTIPFTLAEPGRLRLDIFDLAGRRVARLADGRFVAGRHKLIWDGDSQSSGVYFARLSTAGFEESRRLVLLR